MNKQVLSFATLFAIVVVQLGSVKSAELTKIQPVGVKRAVVDSKIETETFDWEATEVGSAESASAVNLACHNEAGCNGTCGNHGCCVGASCEPWTLYPQDPHCGWNLTGWAQAGLTVNSIDNGGRNDPLAFSSPASEFLLNQLWMTLHKPIDTGGAGVDIGFRLDYVYGADGPDTASFGDGGWDFRWDTNGEYGSAIPQIYGEIGINNLSFKLGHFLHAHRLRSRHRAGQLFLFPCLCNELRRAVYAYGSAC